VQIRTADELTHAPPVFELAGETRPEISVLSDEFVDEITRGITRPAVGVQILKKILSDEIRVAAARTRSRRSCSPTSWPKCSSATRFVRAALVRNSFR
jgi:Domain of unknown function (DUF3387)